MQRIPKGAAKRHTSTVTIAVLAAGVDPRVELRAQDVDCDVYRDSGPGGQHRNTSDTAVRLTHRPTGIVVCATASRSQATNRDAAWKELRRRLEARASGELAAEERGARLEQIGMSGRTNVAWTWNGQRGVVTHHESGRKWAWKQLAKGRWD